MNVDDLSRVSARGRFRPYDELDILTYMIEPKKKSIITYKKKLLLLAAVVLTLLLGFVGYRWYKVSHPYSYVSFTTFAPANQEPQDVMLHLQGYSQNIFDIGESYLPKKVSLAYTLSKENLLVTQTKSTSPTLNEADCNKEMNTVRCTLVSHEGQSFIELRSNSDNSDGHIEAILLQKATTRIHVQPITTDRVISNEEWRTIIATALAHLEAKSFQGSPYRFFDSWNI